MRIIDTSSLLSFVKYYLPFDTNGVLFNVIQEKISTGAIIVIDKVYDECKYTSKGLVLEKLPYLRDKANPPYKTDSLIAPSPQRFLNQISSQFVNTDVRKLKGLTDIEFQEEQDVFLETADIKMIVLCLHFKREDGTLELEEDVVLITEETQGANDNKLFKKIPTMCKVTIYLWGQGAFIKFKTRFLDFEF